MVHRWFALACLAELSLLGLAVLLGALFHQPVFSPLRFTAIDCVWGVASVLPLAPVFFWMVRSPLRPLREIRRFLDECLRPVMQRWAWWQLLAISLIAGIAEESLFRAVIQGALAQALPRWTALALASVIFGLGHAVTRAYAAIATLIGAYLGVLWIVTDNLLPPVVAHGLYDFGALMYFLRVHPPTGEAAAPKSGQRSGGTSV